MIAYRDFYYPLNVFMHILTHEEGIDQNLGCQPQVAWFVERCMEGFRDMLTALDAVREERR